MKRSLVTCAVALPLAALLGGSLSAEVKTREKTHIKLEGMLGRVVGMFGGKAAREGIVSTTAVKGNRKASLNDTNGQIIDLGEEKIYDLDFKKKEYRVTTFEELRQRMKEAQERAKKDVEREQGREEKITIGQRHDDALADRERLLAVEAHALRHRHPKPRASTVTAPASRACFELHLDGTAADDARNDTRCGAAASGTDVRLATPRPTRSRSCVRFGAAPHPQP